jgi:endonuclease YncB( thermonuclease family)
MPPSRRRRRKKPHPIWKTVRILLVLAVAASVLQYLQNGSVTWPGDLYQKIATVVSDYPARPAAGWRRATEGLGELGSRREGEDVPDFDLEGRVVKIMDGDSLSLLDQNNRQVTVRLFGIDTPEWNQPHGERAKRALEKMVDGRRVGVVTEDTDTFGRTVGTVFIGNTNVNLAMVKAGHAWWFARYAPYERQLAAAEESARERGIGLWSSGEPKPPWQWRREQRR